MNPTEVVAVFVIATFVASTLVNTYRLKSINKKLMAEVSQLELDNDILTEKIIEMQEKEQSDKLNTDDGFVKFLSQSRDWAFAYIEDVQLAIQEAVSVIESDNIAKSKNTQIKNIVQALNKLKQFMPDGKGDK